MTLFEYLSVLVSIILSFGIIRLLQGLPVVFKREGGYVIQGLWVVIVLWLHIHVWWVLWSYSEDVAWSYPRFLILLADPLLLYSMAITLVPRDLLPTGSWRDHFYRVRVRLFVLLAIWMAAVSVANWQLLETPLLSGMRAGHVGFIALCTVGAVFPRPKMQGVVVALTLVVMILLTGIVFFRPAALMS